MSANLMNSFAHAILVLKAAYKLAQDSRRTKVTRCPHCHKSVAFGEGVEPVRGPAIHPAVAEQESPRMTGASVAESESLVEA
jgi:hypothetical protein